MKPTAISSLLFSIPLITSLYYNQIFHALHFGILIVTSILNNGRIFKNETIHWYAAKCDRLFARILTLTLTYRAFTIISMCSPMYGITAGSCGILAGYIYKNKRTTADHIILHIVGTIGFTFYVIGSTIC